MRLGEAPGASAELLSATQSVEDIAKAPQDRGPSPEAWRSCRPGRAASSGPDDGWPRGSNGRTGAHHRRDTDEYTMHPLIVLMCLYSSKVVTCID